MRYARGFTVVEVLVVVVILGMIAGAGVMWRQFYSHRPDGSDAQVGKPLTAHNEQEADDTVVAFTKDGQLWVVGADGSGLLNVRVRAKDPVVAPNQHSVAYIRDQSIFIYNLQTKREVELPTKAVASTATTYGASLGNLRWSYDGKMLAYSLMVDVCLSDCSVALAYPAGVKEGIWVTNVATKVTTFLIPAVSPDDPPGYRWDGDSQHIIYTVYDGGGPATIIKSVDVTTKHIVNYDLQHLGCLDFSRNGATRLYCTLTTLADVPGSVLDTIYVKNMARVLVFANSGKEKIYYDESMTTNPQPAISGDGHYVFYTDHPNSAGQPQVFKVKDVNSGMIYSVHLPSSHEASFDRWDEPNRSLIFEIPDVADDPNGKQDLWRISFANGSSKKIASQVDGLYE